MPLCLPLQDAQITHIYGVMMKQKLEVFEEELKPLAQTLTQATLELYHAVSQRFLPTPSNTSQAGPKKGRPCPTGSLGPTDRQRAPGSAAQTLLVVAPTCPPDYSPDPYGAVGVRRQAHFCSPPSVKMRTINRRYSYSQTPYKGRHGSVYKRAEK